MSDSLDVGEHALDWSEDVGGGLSDKNVEKFYNNIWGGTQTWLPANFNIINKEKMKWMN